MATSRRFLAACAALAVVAGLTAVAGPAAAADPPVRLFVAPAGDDANPGTSPQRALRTPERARDLVRAMNQDMTADIVVTLLPGTYRLARPSHGITRVGLVSRSPL